MTAEKVAKSDTRASTARPRIKRREACAGAFFKLFEERPEWPAKEIVGQLIDAGFTNSLIGATKKDLRLRSFRVLEPGSSWKTKEWRWALP